MFEHVIVPIDGSEAAWRAVVVGDRLASWRGGRLEVVHVFRDDADGEVVRRLAEHRLDTDGFESVSPRAAALRWDHSVSRTIAKHLRRHGGQIVMSTAGHGRAGPLLGDVAVHLLTEDVGPVVVVGPNVATLGMNSRGPMLVAVDIDAESLSTPATVGAMLGIVAAWSAELGLTPCIVMVAPADSASRPGHGLSPAGIAYQLAETTEHHVEVAVLHGPRPAALIADYAGSIDAPLIMATTRARVGFDRVVHGSDAARLARLAPCPVVLIARPGDR